MTSLDRALTAASPRRSPVALGLPLPSLLIHAGVAALWASLFACAFVLHGVYAWSAGVAYVVYDTILLAFVFRQTLRLFKTPAPSALPDQRRTLGVIVAAYNEATVLPSTLAGLAAQSDRPDQIVIADDGSTDGTLDLLSQQYGLEPPLLGCLSEPSPVMPNLRWLRMPHGGKARTLNGALGLIDAEIVMTVDADTKLDRGAVAAMRDAFSADPNLVAATGVLTPVCGRDAAGRFFQWFQTYEYIRNFLSRFAWMQLNSLLLISGAFAGYRRAAVNRVGGFDPDCLVEDYELSHRLLRYGANHGLGWRTGVIGQARAVTEAPSTIPSFLRQRRRWFGGFLQTQYRYRDMVGDRAYGWLGLAMLPVKAIDTMQPVYGLTALGILLAALLQGHVPVLVPVAGVIAAKITIDLAFHLWSVRLYRRWIGDRTSASLFYALLAALAEPFSFQILRHTGAALGWAAFLTGRASWGVQRRLGLAA
jgi:cellulose synthase/poly-beta-1,6-N-acetylglucosamine synthase-like glycosyltransferase